MSTVDIFREYSKIVFWDTVVGKNMDPFSFSINETVCILILFIEAKEQHNSQRMTLFSARHFTLCFLGWFCCCEAQLPPGFMAQQVAHIASPTSISHVPTSTEGVERLLATSKGGKLFLVTITEDLSSNVNLENVQVQKIADFRSVVCTRREFGLMAAVAHPDFANGSPYIYVYYADKSDSDCKQNPETGPHYKVVRFEYRNGELDRTTDHVLLLTPRPYDGIHGGGNMAFGNDGLLYISVGDGGGNGESQDPSNLLGTIVRLHDDGSVPESNPYAATGEPCRDSGSTVGAEGVCQEMFALGLRNPFKITMNPNSDDVNFWISDVGAGTWEEINECGAGYAGANYGFPKREGPCKVHSKSNCGVQDRFQDPVYWYAHNENRGAVIGSAISESGMWPQDYDHVFFGDFPNGKIYMITQDVSSECRDCSPPIPAYQNITFHLEAPRVVDIRFVPFRNSQALYYLTYVGDFSLRRVVYRGDNNVPPVAVIETNVSGPVPSSTAIQFDGTGSYDDNKDILTYRWEFGDGQNSTSAMPSHQYSQDGQYVVSLVVSDGELISLAALAEIQIGVPPTVEILNPTADEMFAVGEVYTLMGQAFSEGIALADSSLLWEVRQIHDNHYHPFLSPQTGNNIELSPAFAPEDFLAATNSFLRILLTATDANGLQTTVTRDVLPIQRVIEFRTEPSGLSIEADGFVINTPATYVSWENHRLLLTVPDTERYNFEKWSTGGARSHLVTISADVRTITAFYYDANETCGSASCGGDPHFTTWSGKHFNYHGQCDLVLAHAPQFHRNQGFDLHARTKVEGIYSIVTAAAIQLGDSVLEFNHETVGKPKIYFNRGEKQMTDLPLTAGNFSVSMRQLHNDDLNADVAIYEIEMGRRALVSIEVLNQWVMVSVKALEKDLAGSIGLLGSYPKGEMIARDGVTDLSINRNVFGADWQVQADEPQLFHSIPDDHPQAPHQSCRLPENSDDVMSYLRTRRAETYKSAMEVCMKEGVTGADLDDCVFDVSMTGSPALAAAWWGKAQSKT